LLQDLRGLSGIALAIGQIGSAQAQQGRIFRRFALGGLFEQLLDAGIRGPWKFAKAGRRASWRKPPTRQRGRGQ
jgi:hypothetical protein